MLLNYCITSLRMLHRNKGYSAITILGLAMGIACCTVIFLIIRYETGFDRFHSKFERIYRIVTNETINGASDTDMGTPMPMAEALRNDVPNIEHVTVVASHFTGRSLHCWSSLHFLSPARLHTLPCRDGLSTLPIA